MGTRSAIGVRVATGQVTAIYCHWDGYPSHNGAILNEHYNTAEKITELMLLGSLSSLRPEIGEKHAFSQFELPAEEVEAYKALTENWCTAYGRDRGESNSEARVFNDVMDFVENFNSGEEYFYLWNGKEWLVNAYGRKSANGFPEFERLEDVLAEAQEA